MQRLLLYITLDNIFPLMPMTHEYNHIRHRYTNVNLLYTIYYIHLYYNDISINDD